MTAPAAPAPMPALDRLIVDNLTTAVLLFDEHGRLEALNSAAEALLDTGAKVARGLAPRDLLPDVPAFAAAVERVAATGEPLAERDMTVAVAGREPPVPVDCVVTPLSEAAPRARVLVEVIELEHHRRLAREEQLVAQSETARAVLRSLAHEIKNPLGGLRGAAQLLERELADAGLREYTEVIVREADRLQSLVDRMLGPRDLPRRCAVNVHVVTERVRRLLEAEAPAGVVVERDYDPSIPDLHADPEHLIQALLNVGRNALQALGERGRVTLRTRIHRGLTIGARRHRLVVRVEVEDDGPGVAPELRELIFYPLVSGRAQGTGLGLSIAQSLVTRHGGIIECHDRARGTTFAILLPVENAG